MVLQNIIAPGVHLGGHLKSVNHRSHGKTIGDSLVGETPHLGVVERWPRSEDGFELFLTSNRAHRMLPNARDEARGAEGLQHVTEAESRRRLHHVCSALSLFWTSGTGKLPAPKNDHR